MRFKLDTPKFEAVEASQAAEAFCEARPSDERRERERRNLQKAVEAS